ncbi:MAG: hypothetical protein FWB86_10375 [Treponema sp.]|nr:hypothetical protein [Treponema sp.]MCL2252323.1 hypothetical protein [Treponema sp.]
MKRFLFLPLFIFLIFPLRAQERPLNIGLSIDEQHSFIGMIISEVFERYGPPRSVASARGIELWQDDVVFHYTGVDFYIYRDRVWQVKFTTTYGISNGEPKASVMLTLGNKAQDMGDHLLLPIAGNNWPLMLRVNLNDAGRVSAIYLFRPDY